MNRRAIGWPGGHAWLERPARPEFEATVRRRIEDGLVGGDGFAVDASLIRAEANRQNFCEGAEGLPADPSSRAIEEYLAVLDDAAFGAATPVEPKRVSPVDPASRYTSAHGGQAQFCYSTNYLIDVKHAVIVDVEASTAVRQVEVTAAKRMIERVADGHGAARAGVRQVRTGRRLVPQSRLHLRP